MAFVRRRARQKYIAVQYAIGNFLAALNQLHRQACVMQHARAFWTQALPGWHRSWQMCSQYMSSSNFLHSFNSTAQAVPVACNTAQASWTLAVPHWQPLHGPANLFQVALLAQLLLNCTGGARGMQQL
jgi:hypothetical protein